MNYQEQYQDWLTNSYFDDRTKEELKAIASDENEIKERFYKELEFGTAGLRGIIGAGTNRMNIYTVRKATQGLANYIVGQGFQDKGVAVAYDSRRMSPEFAAEAALCLAANGVKAYVFESLRPTPQLSYAVRKLGCIAGINITASHNPPEYNGYKVYWEDGAQITPPHDKGIMGEVQKVTDYNTVKTMDLEAAKEAGLYVVIGKEIDDAYIEELKKQVIHQDAIKAVGKDLKIVYSPLHGTGNIPARRILKELGFENVYVVKEQELPDGEFPTVSYPNPESAEAFELGLKLAKEVDADLILATDPDADRLGVYVKDAKSGEYKVLTGNMSGCLLEEYELSQKQAINGKLPEDGAVISSIVTSNMAGTIAKSYGLRFIEVLTGFKFIGQQMLQFEQTGKGTYLFGFEESYGCLIGTEDREIAAGESEGSNRVKSFAFIAGLVALAKEKLIANAGEEGFNLSSEPYPLVMDAPFSNADETHTANISKVLPEIAEQVIMFVMQKDWRYAEPVMDSRVGKQYHLKKHSETYTVLE